jgi:hypothetical protein
LSTVISDRSQLKYQRAQTPIQSSQSFAQVSNHPMRVPHAKGDKNCPPKVSEVNH